MRRQPSSSAAPRNWSRNSRGDKAVDNTPSGAAIHLTTAKLGDKVLYRALRAAIDRKVHVQGTADEPEHLAAANVQADVVKCDDAVERLAARTVAEFGRIDAWINNAAVSAVGLFEEVPLAEFRRVIDVNLLGFAYGMRAALPHLRAAGGGVLVNNASVLAEVAMPYQSAYNAAKHAVRGLTDTVRQELRVTGHREIALCTVLPATTDTPFFRHAANRIGHAGAVEEITLEEWQRVLGVNLMGVVHGMRAALRTDSTHICQMDADLSHNPADVPRLLDEARGLFP